MAKLYESSLSFPNFFSIDTTNPIDDRFVVQYETDLTNSSVLKYPYVGMVVNVQLSVESDAEMWVLIQWPATDRKNWRKIATENRLRGVQSYLDTRIYGVQTQLEGVQSYLDTRIFGVQTELRGIQYAHEVWFNEIEDKIEGLQKNHEIWMRGIQTELRGIQYVHEEWLRGIQTQLTKSSDGLQNMIDECKSMCGAQHVSIWNKLNNHETRISNNETNIATNTTNISKNKTEINNLWTYVYGLQGGQTTPTPPSFDTTITKDYQITFMDENNLTVGKSTNISNADW